MTDGKNEVNGRAGQMMSAVIMGCGLGILAGIGGYTMLYARATSYLVDNPEACANCHVMQGQLDAWAKSSHQAVATCNDCHTPHSLVPKYMEKARNGYLHSLAFTTGDFHEPIRISEHNEEIVERSCRHCHKDVVAMMDSRAEAAGAVSCLHCHDDVGHM